MLAIHLEILGRRWDQFERSFGSTREAAELGSDSEVVCARSHVGFNPPAGGHRSCYVRDGAPADVLSLDYSHCKIC